MHMDLEPIDPPVLFAPLIGGGDAGATAGRSGAEPAARDLGRARRRVRYHGSDERGVRYDVYLSADDRDSRQEPLTRADDDRYTRAAPQRQRRACGRWPIRLVREKRNAARKSARHREPPSHAYSLRPRAHSAVAPRSARRLSLRRRVAVIANSIRPPWWSCFASSSVPSRNVTGFIGGIVQSLRSLLRGSARRRALLGRSLSPRTRLADVRPDASFGRRAAQRALGRSRFHARRHRSHQAALGSLRRRLRSQPAGVPVRDRSRSTARATHRR